ncbi:MFS transporter [Lactiplantibacillus pentosus]|uniref:MFS transporter n=1 Tax=Lactiplantibacillus pentosus TaxID=1589 RepID=UPI00234A4EBA|nr:MFS transporter [Lactiplantibacillus pentosus]MDC6396130.1 MFS transporter [Lactiplantibacillus pentosus]
MNHKRWRVVPAIIATAIMSFAGVLIETSMNVTFPTLMAEFNTTSATIQWVTTSYLLALAIVIPLSTFLVRNFSIKTLFITANLLFALGVLLDFLSPSLLVLVLGRIIQGVGTGIALPLMFDIILNYAPKSKRGLMMGIATMTTSLAPAIGPTYGGLMLSLFDWRRIFLFLLPFLVLSLFLGVDGIGYESHKRGEPFNFISFLCLAIGLSTLLLAIENLSWLLGLISLISFGFFYRFNRNKPILKLTIFKNSQFVTGLFGVLAIQATVLGLSFILPNYLQLRLHVSAALSGLFMFPGAILVAVLAPLSGIIMDRFGPYRPIVLGLMLTFIGMLLTTVYFSRASFMALLMFDVVLMMGVGFAASNLMAVALSQLTKSEQTDGNGILNTLQQFVGAMSTTIVASLFSTFQGTTGGNLGVLLLLIVLTVASVLFMFKGRQMRI